MEHDIVINEDGSIAFVYDDELAAVFDGEEQVTERASNVEPHPHGGGWYADMIPSGGPVLGDGGMIPQRAFQYADPEQLWRDLKPFKTRAAALAAEREWLRKEKGL
jgi:hypothetical protein